MSALTMLVLSMLVLAVFLCSAAFLSFMIALTYPCLLYTSPSPRD